jgi:uncharacterized protein (TIGR02302 family)
MRSGPGSRLERLIVWSRAALAWESFWRTASEVVAALSLLVAVAWFDLWRFIPSAARPLALIATLAAIGAIVRREAIAARLGRRAAIERLDRSAGDSHGTAATLSDRPANGSDPATAALWRIHLARLEARLARTRVRSPSPRAIEHDRYAWRAGAVLLAVIAGIHAGPDRWNRLAQVASWSGAASVLSPARLDAWIDPPAYTGKPPLMMTGRKDADPESRRFSAPVGSMVVIRAANLSEHDIRPEDGLAPADQAPSSETRMRAAERRFRLSATARLGVGPETFDIAAIPDGPPSVELLEQPRANLRGSLTLSYRTDDDYGVVAAEGRAAEPEINGRPTKGRTLVPAPQMSLTLPPTANGLGDGRATLDLSESPWAGARVKLTLHARDEGGNEAASAPIAIFLPQRNFTKPLARAVVEQRRHLVLEPDSRGLVAAALDALMIEPERFGTTAGAYLGLAAANARLANARNDDQLRDVADLLWSMALQIEDGGLSDAEKELRAAERALRDALQRNAGEDEIRKLTEALRSAMDRFLSEMMQRGQQDRDQAQQGPNPDARTVSREDLRNMLDQLEQMARSGAMADARKLLDQLQDMLENLRNARRGGRQNEAAREMNRMLGDMDKLMRDQQQLRDETYRDSRRQQGRRGGQERRDTPQDGDGDDGRSLRDRQQELRNRLGDIQKRLGRRGGAQGDLKAAEDAMREADGQLGESGDRGKAADAQGRALDALRRGANQLAQQMQNGDPSQQAGRDEGPAMGEPDGQSPSEADPLGRPTRDPRYNPRARYDPMGVSPALRAQRVLEELRRRLGDVSRPQEELDYLERLIRRY